jgi:hypothetical protein
MAVTDVVKSVFDEILREVGKTIGKGKRAVRRKRRTTRSSADGTLQKIERLLRPAKRQVSAARKTRSRAVAQQRRTAAKTAKHRKSLRTGKARR